MNEPFEPLQKLCPKCGEAADVDARFCKYCAFDLTNSDVNQNTSTEVNQNQIENKTPNFILGGVLLVVAVVGLIIFFNSFFNAKKDNQTIVENVNSVSQTSASTLTLGEKGKQIEEKILRNETLTANDLEGLSTSELRILRNVHFARYGRKYERPGLGDYFYSRSWYKPNDGYSENLLTETDKANINLILALEKGDGSVNATNTTAQTNNANIAVQTNLAEETYDETTLDPIDREAEEQSNNYWRTIVSKCGDSYYSKLTSIYSQFPTIYEYKELVFYIDSSPVSSARKMNGIEWSGIWEGKTLMSRFYIPISIKDKPAGWREWNDGFPDLMKLRAIARKVNGSWVVVESTASDHKAIKCSEIPK